MELNKLHDCVYLCPAEIDEVSTSFRFGYLYRKLRSPFIRWLGRFSALIGFFWLTEKLEVQRYQLPEIEDGVFDYIFVHDLYILPHVSHFSNSRVIFDAREYYPLEFSDDHEWKNTTGKLAEYICKKHMPRCYKLLTVSPSITRMYEKLVNKKVQFFPSYPRSELLTTSNRKQDEHLKIKFIHHGNAFKNRGLERMLDLMELLGEGYHLDMMLVSSASNTYFNFIKAKAKNLQNVNIISPVHPDQIIEKCSAYDMGLYLMEVNDNQNKYCLPNKYFEFLYAGLPVITSCSEDMFEIAEKFGLGLGFTTETIEFIAQKIKVLKTRDIDAFQQAVAKTIPNWTVSQNVKDNLQELLQE